jgi:hypothetical protein
MIEEIRPEFGPSGIGPKWWHPHGIKMIMPKRQKRGHLIMESGAAHLEISKNSGGGCTADWKIRHTMSSVVNGSIFMTEKEFKQAFGISEQTDEFGDDILAEYGGSSARAGVFIRYQDWLNLPCPGTGHDGDPNISLKLTEEIKKEAKSFIDGN